MTFATQGKSLPVTYAAYPVTVENIDGFVVTIDGRGGFLPMAQARMFGLYLANLEETDTQPIVIRESIEPQAWRP